MIVYERFATTPAIAAALELIQSIRSRGPSAIAQQASMIRTAWGDVGTKQSPWQNFASLRAAVAWILDERPPLNHDTIYRIHELASPHAKPHRYGEGEQTFVDGNAKTRVLLNGPPWKDVADIMAATFELLPRYPVPIGNALLHLNVTAAHPFENGNSHLRLALSTARTIATTHRAVAGKVIDVIETRWDGFFSGYVDEWANAAGRDWSPERDVTSFVRWWVEGEARMLALSAANAVLHPAA